MLEALVEIVAETQTLQTYWQSHSIQGLIKVKTQSQSLQSCWQNDIIQSLIEAKAKDQALQTYWKTDSIQVPVEFPIKCQASQTGWKCHTIGGVKMAAKRQISQAAWNSVSLLAKEIPESQAFQSCWQSHSIKTLIEHQAKTQMLKTAG